MIRGLTVLASTFRGDVLPSRREEIAGFDALVARPSGGRGPVVVFANAATPRGVDDPYVGRLLGSLARAGFVAVAPELPHVKEAEVTPATVEALVSVARAAGPRVALVGASTGAGLVILAAADPWIADRVSGVAAIAPFASLRSILELGTTSHYEGRPFAAAPLVRTAALRSLAAAAPDDAAVRELLTNRDPARFDELFDALDPGTRSLVEELSPVSRIGDVRAPVELGSSPCDPFFPLDESRALASAGRDVRLTVTGALLHVKPRLRPGALSVVGLLDRTLARAAQVEPRPARQLRPSLTA